MHLANGRIVHVDRAGTLLRHAARLLAAVSIGTLALGCAIGLPYRRAGSDITLRDSPTRQVVQTLVTQRDRATRSLSGTTSARDVVAGGSANIDTVAVNDPQRISANAKTP